uniref:Large ribosomal subunit protein bL21c n=1 Tax=Adiantum capillus-veneris TaxID=13818 RepID=RK21_ADICA|nr:RecName: Full=Large ribosomal subunit protein bL21c; AltName: Full=50S ribosomal protein L21, chloroplastic [Adiantum capillus-veneris]AAP29438.2 ribosomal protein L21 [Adiantum capillus-veneris]
MEKWKERVRIGGYAIIDIGGKQLRVQPGRFYDVRHFPSNLNTRGSDTKVSMGRVLLIRDGSKIDIGSPWLANAVVKGRILHNCFEDKLVIKKIFSKRKTRGSRGCRGSIIRFAIDSIHFNCSNATNK